MTQFNYDPKDAVQLVPEGEYEAVVFTAETGKTKKDDSKLGITSKVYGPEGRSPLVTDNIVAPFGIRRLKQLCAATGVAFNGEVNAQDFVGKNVKVKVIVKHDETGQYDDRNDIRAYMPDGGSPATVPITQPESPSDPPPGVPAGGGVGKVEAWKGYREAICKDRPGTSEELLLKNFNTACEELIGKPEDQFTEQDWIKVRDEGPEGFIPF